jgi:hypothetical protein
MRDQQPGSDLGNLLGNLSGVSIGYDGYVSSNPSGSSTTSLLRNMRLDPGCPRLSLSQDETLKRSF